MELLFEVIDVLEEHRKGTMPIRVVAETDDVEVNPALDDFTVILLVEWDVVALLEMDDELRLGGDFSCRFDAAP